MARTRVPRSTRPSPVSVIACAMALLGTLLVGPARAQNPSLAGALVGESLPPGITASPNLADSDTYLMLELQRTPAALAALRAELTGDTPAQIAAVGRSQLSMIEDDQQQLAAALARIPELEVLYSVQNAYNGIAVRAAPGQAGRLAGLPGVVAVHPLVLHERDNASSVKLIGAPQVWAGVSGLTGAGVTIGVIDTGIDYLHTNFGGPGVYTGSNSTVITDQPSMDYLGAGKKVAGGYDFVGDAYNGGNSATPDPDPIDCASTPGGGHGSHVAGSAAGFGVNSNGSSYSGPYNNTVDLSTLSIGPGVAPKATLYALRVFGCTGGTAYTTQAIDWVMDPNGDGNFADHLDVVNLSLGSPFGSPDDASSAALNNAAAAGVIVVASAGNSGDVYYIGGSPASAARAISVANSVDSTDVVDAFAVNNSTTVGNKPATFSASYRWAASAPLTANLVYPATNTNGCTAFTGADATLVSGRIVLVDWAPQGTSSFPCGSATRANNAASAGAVGIIMASGQTFLDTTIAGNATVRALFTTYTVGQELKSVLTKGRDTGVAVTLSNVFRSSGRLVLPAIEDTLSGSSSRGPQGIANGLKPDVSAPGAGIFSTDSGAGTQGKSLTGTSMAAPHVAGMMALLRQQRPGWSVADLKALVMNTAVHDIFAGPSQALPKYGPARVGAGRVDVPAAVAGQVIAYNSAQPEQVSVSFGALQVLGSSTLTRTVTVQNFGASAQSYAVSYDARTDIPGVSYGFPDGANLTVPAGGTASFRVVLRATADDMRHVRDSTVAGQQAGNPRHWLSEESGLILLTPSSGLALRVPVYATARPATDLHSTLPTLSFSGPTASASITLTGTALRDYNSAVYPAEQVAVVSPLELQYTSPATTTAGLSNADLRYVGVGSDARVRAAQGQLLSGTRLFFGVATHGDWTTPASELQFVIYIDRDRDGTDDVSLFTARLLASGNNTDVFVAAVSGQTPAFLNNVSAGIDTAVFNNSVLVMPVSASQLGLDMSGATARFNYRIESSRSRFGVVDSTPTLTYDARNPGLDFSNSELDNVSWTINSGDALPVSFDQAAYQANASQGALLLHHFGRSGTRAEVLPAGLAQSVSFTPPTSKTYGDAPFSVSASASSALTITLRSDSPGVCGVAGGTVTILGAGQCLLTASQAGDAGYVPASSSATITVAQAALTITANSTTRVAGRPNPSFTASFVGFVNGDSAANLDTAVSLSSSAMQLSKPGSYPISAAGAADANYAITHQGGTLTITGSLSYLPLLRR